MVKNNHGMAIIVTLAVVAAILAGVLELNGLAKNSAVGIHREQERFVAREKAMAGIHLGMALLVLDAENSTLDSVQEDWARPEILAQMVEALGFDQKDLVIRIEDELGKIQMNALVKRFPGHAINPDQQLIWHRFLDLNLSKDNHQEIRDAAGIVNCAIDWMDSGDNDAITGLSGAESSDYSMEPVPYPCANGPFDQSFELFSLKGVHPEMFQGGIQKVRDAFTVYGLDENKTNTPGFSFSGRININTAKADILAALLPEGSEFRVADLIDFRQQKTGTGQTFINTLERGWYERVIALSNNEKIFFERVIRYSSDLFSIRSTGRENKTEVHLKAVVKRESKEGEKCRIIQLEQES